MDKLVYIAQIEYDGINPDGVCKKVLQQTRVFSLYYDTYLIAYKKNEIVVVHNNKCENLKSKTRKHRKLSLYECAEKFVSDNKICNVYFRYGYSEPLFIRFCKKIKSCGAQIIVEIPSYPYWLEAKGNFQKMLQYFVDVLTRDKMKNYVKFITVNSNESQIFGIPVIKISNGVFVEEIPLRSAKQSKDSALHMIAVSSMEKWHGFDRMIKGINQYYEKEPERDVVLHLVGEGAELSLYKQLAEQCPCKNAIVFHGFLSGKELDKVFDESAVAITSLGLHRIGIAEENTIKTREYVARGELVVTEAQKDCFDTTYSYVYRVPFDESSIDINEILDFYEKAFVGENIENSIRNYAIENLDMKKVMYPIIAGFSKEREL